MDVQSVASISPIVADPSAAKAFYQQGLGLSFEGEADDYVFTEELGGVKHFGLWRLTDAAQACYGQPDWPSGVPVPQASLEFELASPDAVPAAAAELAGQGHQLIHDARAEPWGQVIARLLSPEGMVVGVSTAPSLVVRGENSPFVTSDLMERMVAMRPHVVGVTIRWAGHNAHTDQPDAFHTAVGNWLGTGAAGKVSPTR